MDAFKRLSGVDCSAAVAGGAGGNIPWGGGGCAWQAPIDFGRVTRHDCETLNGGTTWNACLGPQPWLGQPMPPVPSGTKAACALECGAKKAQGCCEFDLVARSCTFLAGHWVDGSGAYPSKSANNCHDSGACDAWNDAKRCNPKPPHAGA